MTWDFDRLARALETGEGREDFLGWLEKSVTGPSLHGTRKVTRRCMEKAHRSGKGSCRMNIHKSKEDGRGQRKIRGRKEGAAERESGPETKAAKGEDTR